MLYVVAILMGLLPAAAHLPDPKQPQRKVYSTGRIAPKNLHVMRAQSVDRHAEMLKALPKVTAASWDCRALGVVPPIKDQGNCGSCWDFSGTSICESALIKAGYGKADGTFGLSEQYTLDCGRNGGCNGDDNTTVTIWAKSTGLPTDKEYGPYRANPASCKSGVTLLKITDWGFCTTSNQDGVANTQDIKNAMVQFGPIGSAIAADDAFANNPPGRVFSGNSSNINHDIVLVGWDDAKGAWLLRNSWGNWCDSGYCWIKYGANQVGTEAIWVTAAPLPGPVPPPVPPVPPIPPPVPGGAPTITSPLTATAVVNTTFTYQITATNSPVVFGAIGLPAGLTCSASGTISGTPTATGSFHVALLAANGSGAGTAQLTVNVVSVLSPVTINLTQEQVQAVIAQSGAIVINSGMSMKQLLEALEKCVNPPAGAAPSISVPGKMRETPDEPPLAVPQATIDAVRYNAGTLQRMFKM